jgi:nucleoside-diphosphate-sugar epimerase
LNSNSGIIITGSSGFIGSALCGYFKRNKISCLGISRKAAKETDIVVKNYNELINYNDGNTLLINLAGNNSFISKGEIDIISSLSESYKEKMIFISSAQVYGDDSKEPISESQKLSNMNDYSKSKISLEKTILKNKGMVLRLSNIYGKGMADNNVFGHVNNQIIKNKKNINLRDTTAIRDFLYIDDFCECMLKIISNGVRNLILNIGTGKGTDILTIVKIMCKSLNYNYSDKNIISNELVTSSLVLDIGLLIKTYNWVPRTTIEQGIEKWLK